VNLQLAREPMADDAVDTAVGGIDYVDLDDQANLRRSRRVPKQMRRRPPAALSSLKSFTGGTRHCHGSIKRGLSF
jgi:hypothetical protein